MNKFIISIGATALAAMCVTGCENKHQGASEPTNDDVIQIGRAHV